LNKEDKEVFEERARKLAAEMEAKQQEADKALNESIQRSQSPWEGGQASPRPATPGKTRNERVQKIICAEGDEVLVDHVCIVLVSGRRLLSFFHVYFPSSFRFLSCSFVFFFS
jgi:hypothetical protein